MPRPAYHVIILGVDQIAIFCETIRSPCVESMSHLKPGILWHRSVFICYTLIRVLVIHKAATSIGLACAYSSEPLVVKLLVRPEFSVHI